MQLRRQNSDGSFTQSVGGGQVVRYWPDGTPWRRPEPEAAPRPERRPFPKGGPRRSRAKAAQRWLWVAFWVGVAVAFYLLMRNTAFSRGFVEGPGPVFW